MVSKVAEFNKPKKKTRGSAKARLFEAQPKRSSKAPNVPLTTQTPVGRALTNLQGPDSGGSAQPKKKEKAKKMTAMERFREKAGLDKDNLAKILQAVPPVDRDKPHSIAARNAVHQADLIYLPDDDGYKYALVVVDVGSRLTDAEALNDRSEKAVTDALKRIYSRGILEPPTVMMQTDNGSEFKKGFNTYIEQDLGVKHRFGKPGRSRQQAYAESHNFLIGKMVAEIQANEELITGQTNREWVESLPLIVEAMNEHLIRPLPMERAEEEEDPVCKGKSCDLIPEGTKVRTILDKPKGATGERLHGGFRAGDIRWETEIRTVVQQILKPGQPPLYLVSDRPNVGYTRAQLLVVGQEKKQLQEEEPVEDIAMPVNSKVSYYDPDYDQSYRGVVTLRKKDGTIRVRFEPDEQDPKGSTAEFEPPYDGLTKLEDDTELDFQGDNYEIAKLSPKRKIIKGRVHIWVNYKFGRKPGWASLKSLTERVPEMVKEWKARMKKRT